MCATKGSQVKPINLGGTPIQDLVEVTFTSLTGNQHTHAFMKLCIYIYIYYIILYYIILYYIILYNIILYYMHIQIC